MRQRLALAAKLARNLLIAGLYGAAVAFVGALVFVPGALFVGLSGFVSVLFALNGFVVMVLPCGFVWGVASAFLHKSRIWWLAAVAGTLPMAWKFFDEGILHSVMLFDASSVTIATVCVTLLLMSLIFFGSLSWLLLNRENLILLDFRHWDAVSAFADAAPFNSWKTGRRIVFSSAMPVTVLALLIGTKLQPVLAANQVRIGRYGVWQVLEGSWRHIVPSRRYESCPDNLKRIGLAMALYSQDFGERFPLKASRGKFYGWADELQPYLRDLSTFQCPREAWRASGSDQRLPAYTDYWFNANLNGEGWASLSRPADTFAFGDGNDGTGVTNARYSLKAIPMRWLTASNSPALRHFNGCNFAFADGHVKFHPITRAIGTSSFSIR